jgi:glycerol-3-phosphate dehydrogenase
VQQPLDLLVIGGGINGAAIARDAAGRGLKVLLCEKGDLGQATSSASSKLIHGGLRYLEYYEFRLVREALSEREVLLRAAPHIIWPLRFVLPHDAGLRPAWMIRAGLFLYDHLGRRGRLPASTGLDLRRDPAGRPLKQGLTKGFTYSDCWAEDSRLVVLNAIGAREAGAEIRTRTACTAARRADGVWEATLEPEGGQAVTVRARALVNAAGPWVDRVLDRVADTTRKSGLRLVKGSHIVVPRLHDGAQAYILQNEDRRVVFVLPFEDRFSLIGTTDVPFEGDPADVRIDEEETAYLCAAVSRYFEKPVVPDQVVWSYAGVRPLYDDAKLDASAVTRDYVFDIDEGDGKAPLLSVFGGKLTTHRRLAEHALDTLGPHLGHQDGAWTREAPLPGGDMPDADFERFLAGFSAARPWLPAPLARRYARAYGTRAEGMLARAGGLADLGEDLGDGLYAAEVDYLIREEWARSAEDILWRRSKLGLHLGQATRDRLADWLARHDAGEDTLGGHDTAAAQ